MPGRTHSQGSETLSFSSFLDKFSQVVLSRIQQFLHSECHTFVTNSLLIARSLLALIPRKCPRWKWKACLSQSIVWFRVPLAPQKFCTFTITSCGCCWGALCSASILLSWRRLLCVPQQTCLQTLGSQESKGWAASHTSSPGSLFRFYWY